MWFDGANGEGPNGRKQTYDWPRIWSTVRRLQPDAVRFSDAGPDIRWIGNERGAAGETNWSMVNPNIVPVPGATGADVMKMLQEGDPAGSVWRPGETDVSIRPGWFHHAAEDDRVKSAENLVDLFFTSVGRNSKLLLNVPPTRDGVIHDVDVGHLSAMRTRLDSLFATDLALGKTVASTDPRNALQVDLGSEIPISILDLRENIDNGQVVVRYGIEVSGADESWRTLAEGTTIGYRKLHRVPVADAVRRVRLTVRETLSPWQLRLGVYGP